MLALVPLLALLAAAPGAAQPERWRCVLETPDGPLPFELAIGHEDAFLVNGEERLEILEFERTPERLRLGFPHYASEIVAAPEGNGWRGEWTKVRGPEEVARVPFRAEPWPGWRFEPQGAPRPPEALAGRWRVDFESSDAPAVALLEGERACIILALDPENGTASLIHPELIVEIEAEAVVGGGEKSDD